MLTSRESDYNEATKEDFHCFDWFCIHTLPIISPKWRDISVQETKRMSKDVTATDEAYEIFVLETNKLYGLNEIEKEKKTPPANEAGDETEDEGRNVDGIVEAPLRFTSSATGYELFTEICHQVCSVRESEHCNGWEEAYQNRRSETVAASKQKNRPKNQKNRRLMLTQFATFISQLVQKNGCFNDLCHCTAQFIQ